ncbi:hypothetical protein [Erysipelothrix sp. P66]|uniref:hypothetical protein n=1 Tax=Erysipelothrix sp. P66 TaxID=3141531 RepID=UPI00315CE8A4
MTQIIELGSDDRVVIEKDKIVITKEGKEHVEMVLKKESTLHDRILSSLLTAIENTNCASVNDLYLYSLVVETCYRIHDKYKTID